MPELHLRQIARWCDRHVPSGLRNQVRVEYRVRGRTVTIVECRPPFLAELGPDWTETRVAQLRYAPDQGPDSAARRSDASRDRGSQVERQMGDRGPESLAGRRIGEPDPRQRPRSGPRPPGGGRWTLYWSDSNNRWHPLPDVPPATGPGPLLSTIEANPHGVFWG